MDPRMYILLPPRVVVDLDDRSAGLDHEGNPRKEFKHRTETIPAGLEQLTPYA